MPGWSAQIRTWRPEAILTGSSDPQQDEAVVSLLRQAVPQAADEAADADAFRDQIAEAGLEPWRSSRFTPRCRRAARAASN